jgi:hypothetical protein
MCSLVLVARKSISTSHDWKLAWSGALAPLDVAPNLVFGVRFLAVKPLSTMVSELFHRQSLIE